MKATILRYDEPVHEFRTEAIYQKGKGWKQRGEEPGFKTQEWPDGTIRTEFTGPTGRMRISYQKHCARVYLKVDSREIPAILQAKYLHPDWGRMTNKEKKQFAVDLDALVGKEIEVTEDGIDYDGLREYL